MPELPEVETMRRGIASAAGMRVCDVRRPRSRLRAIQIEPALRCFRQQAVGKRILGVGRAGKRVVLELDDGRRIIIEPRMTGLVLGGDPPDLEHVRLVFELSDDSDRRSQIVFWDQRGLGVVRLVSPLEFDEFCGPGRLGPDALDLSPQELRKRLAPRRRPIKVALLDQRLLAGIGNLYASEILHQARLHPATRCDRIRAGQWQRLHAAMVDILRKAIRHEGSTLRDGTYRMGRRRTGRYQHCHRVYQRAGQPCLQCGKAEVLRIIQAQRSTFFCPACQRGARG
jgi:formamidopyrimidine-DNA glycosylase